MLGTVRVKIAPLKSGQSQKLNSDEFNTLIDETVAKAASTAGASAAILMQVSRERDGTSYCYYRLVVYLPEGAVVDAPIWKDATVMDADGNKVSNGLEKPITTLQWPDMTEGNRWRPAGTAFVHVCVGIDGAVTESSIVTSSGDKESDALGLKAARNARYSPATVRGRPVNSCKNYRITWKNH